MTERLERYREMRDFARTPEPSGKRARRPRASRSPSLRYYIQRHDASRLHYDFRLELDGVLKSWAVPKGPSLDPQVKRLAVEVEDHPLEYGEFEGVIPEKQYGAGDVLLWDKGSWTPEDRDPEQALRKGRLHFRLDGVKLSGSWVLARMRTDDKKPQWLLRKRDDEAARSGEVTREKPESVKEKPKSAGRAKTRKARRSGYLPPFVTPQLATLVDQPPRSGDWVYEVKYDGYRLLAKLANGEAQLFTRAGNDWTAKLPHLAAALKKLKLDGTWLDGEIVVPGEDGRASFQQLQNAFDAGNDAKIVYYVFDAPYLNGEDQRGLALLERKKRLAGSLEGNKAIRYSEHLSADADQALEHACKLKLEGLIAKRADGVYASGRSRDWLKLKCRQRQDFVIGGYTSPKGSRQGFGALLVGFYEQGKLRYAGKVGTGFDDGMLKSLLRKFSPVKEPQFENPPRERGVTWLKPSLVAEVEFAERTDEGLLRQAAFMGLRRDLPAKQVGEEKAVKAAEVEPVKITHPDRLIWPKLKVTKADFAGYIEAVGEWLLPHFTRRPVSLVRCPDGAEGKCFYQRHPALGIAAHTFRREKPGKPPYIYLQSLRDVVAAVQYGAVEFHTWGATVPDVAHPDRFTIDLDPDEALPWKTLREATQMVKALLDELGLQAFLKTTGGKGLHVVAPIEPKLGWDEVKEFTRGIALFLQRARPDLFIANMSKAKRSGKIFVDYLRNAETASAIAAYSARARREGGVSTPLAWDELGAADLRGRYTVKTLPARLRRLRADPWQDYFSARQAITPQMRRALGG
jgi:bifunctional non-homologous end joining protein LigD